VRSLAVLGNLSRDVVDGGPPRAGGAPYYAAQALRAIGFPARIATKCAPRDRAFVRQLAALGVPVSWRPAASTAGFTFSYEDGDRRMVVDELGEPWSPREAREAGRADWVHVAPLARSDFPAETVAALARGARVSFDGQGLVRPGRTGPLELDAEFDPELLRHVRVLKLAEEEAEVVGDVTALGVPEVVVTLGARGSLVWWGGKLERVPAQPARQVSDPTGAGDAFAVVYLSARTLGYRPAAAARRAAQVVAGLLR
jgi:sugar/nucleoside kinase (ribokinase family)